MNCKQGDLAVIVKSRSGNEGLIVECVEFLPRCLMRLPNGSIEEAKVWRVDRPLRKFTGKFDPYIRDSSLRPLRDNPGPDESLLWAPVPSKVVA